MRPPLLVLALLAAAAGAAVAADGADRQAKRPATVRPFAATSFWNTPIPGDAPLDPRSDTWVADVVSQVAAHKPWINTTEYSSPVYTVGEDQPTQRVTLDAPDPLLQRAFNRVPLPAGARPAPGTDGHLVVWQPSRDQMWEFWRLSGSDGAWRAAWGGWMPRVSRNPGRFLRPSHWGATATSLPLLGGMIRLSELKAGRIDHALALSLPETRARLFTWPAQRTDGALPDGDAIPQGARFRLDPSLDLETLGLTPVGLMIARAVQRYGLVVRDTGGAVSFYGEDPAPTGSDPYPALFAGRDPAGVLQDFPWNHLQALATRQRVADE